MLFLLNAENAFSFKIFVDGFFLYELEVLNNISRPWLLWLSGLSTSLGTKGSPVRFPVREHAWIAGQVRSPIGGAREATAS